MQLLDAKYWKCVSQVRIKVENHYPKLDFSFLDGGEDIIDPVAHDSHREMDISVRCTCYFFFSLQHLNLAALHCNAFLFNKRCCCLEFTFLLSF